MYNTLIMYYRLSYTHTYILWIYVSPGVSSKRLKLLDFPHLFSIFCDLHKLFRYFLKFGERSPATYTGHVKTWFE